MPFFQPQLNVLSAYTGSLGNNEYYKCNGGNSNPPVVVNDQWGSYSQWSGLTGYQIDRYTTKFLSGGIVSASNGELFIADSFSHSLYRGNGLTRIMGASRDINAAPGITSVDTASALTPPRTYYFSADASQLQTFCNTNFGQPCTLDFESSPNSVDCNSMNIGTRSCSYVRSGGRGQIINVLQCTSTQTPITQWATSSGTIGIQGTDLYSLNKPTSIIGGPNNALYIADTGNNRVLKYDLNSNSASIYAGNQQTLDNGDGGLATNAGIFGPTGLTFDNLGNLYISTNAGYIRKVDAAGTISTVAGQVGGTTTAQAPAATMAFLNPQGLAYDSASQYLYVSDTGHNRVVQINMKTMIGNTIAGGSCYGNSNAAKIGDGAAALYASLCSPGSIGLDNQNNLLIADAGNSRIRRVTFGGSIGGTLTFSSSNNDSSVLTKYTDGTWNRKLRNGTVVNFDSSGYEVQKQDLLGRVTSVTYDGYRNIQQITYPNQTSLKYQINSSGYVTGVTDPAGRTTSFTITGGLLNQVTFPDNSARSFVYDSNGQMVSEVDPNGYTTSYKYNQWARLIEVDLPDGTSRQINDIGSLTVANNFTSSNAGAMQNPGFGQSQTAASVTNGNNVTTKMTTDYMGYVSNIQDALNHTTTITRDLLGHPTNILRPDKTSVAMTYDPVTGDLLSVTDKALNTTTIFTYDAYGNITTKSDPPNSPNNLTQYNYDRFENLTSVVFPNGNSVSYQYNALGLVILKTVSNGQASLQTSYSYDGYGNLASLTDNAGHVTTFINDNVGNPLQSVSTPDGTTLFKTFFTYDSFNRINSVTSPRNELTSYSYFPAGQIQSVTDAKGFGSSYSYDQLGRIKKVVDPLGFSTNYGYDGAGNRNYVKDPNGNSVSMIFDPLNRISTATYPDDQIAYQYDLRNNVAQVQNNVSVLNFVTDTQGNTVSADIAGIGSMREYPYTQTSYQFDASNKKLSMSAPLFGTLSYVFDNNSNLSQVANDWGANGGDHFSFARDPSGRLTQITRPNGAVTVDYLPSGLIGQIQYL